VSLARDSRTPSQDARAETIVWLRRFEVCVRERRYEEARTFFSDTVLGFGTNVRKAVGLKELEGRQWRVIWEASSDFRFDLDELVLVGDEHLRVVALPWTSIGYDAERRPFQRPGRATIVLARREDAWLAVHTHFSLDPGVPEATFARGPNDGA